MKTLKIIFCFLSLMLLSANKTFAQTDTTIKTSNKLFVITTNDGGEFIGTIVAQDAREVTIDTKDRGQVIIPKYQIKDMHELKAGELSSKGDYIPNEIFSTRYFLTTNGLPIVKGENYVQWNFWGADIEFAVGKNLGVGVMTSWFGVPLVGSIKYSISLADKVNLGLGALAGTASWVQPDVGGVLPFGALTIGDRRRNATFSAGYGAFFNGNGNSQGRALISFGGMSKVGKKVSLVFDSFIVPPGSTQIRTGYYGNGQPYSYTTNRPGGALLIPGVRIQTQQKSAFQFGFGGLVFDGEIIPFPIPFVQLFRQF